MTTCHQYSPIILTITIHNEINAPRHILLFQFTTINTYIISFLHYLTHQNNSANSYIPNYIILYTNIFKHIIRSLEVKDKE